MQLSVFLKKVFLKKVFLKKVFLKKVSFGSRLLDFIYIEVEIANMIRNVSNHCVVLGDKVLIYAD